MLTSLNTSNSASKSSCKLCYCKISFIVLVPGSVSESEYSTGMIGLGLETIWIEGSVVKRNDEKFSGKVVRQNFCSSLDRLKLGDRIGLKYDRSVDGSVKIYINGEDCGGSVGTNTFAVSKKFYPIVEVTYKLFNDSNARPILNFQGVNVILRCSICTNEQEGQKA